VGRRRSSDSSDPFDLLELSPDATAEEIRAARRRLAKERHPDAGGDAELMRALNVAAADALRRIDETGVSSGASSPETSSPGTSSPGTSAAPRRVAEDVPSFTIEALPVEAFEGLLLAAAAIGEVVDDDPPYRLDVVLASPLDCWCRLDVLPEAGASSVSITIGALDDRPLVDVETVRDHWVAALNELDWPDAP